MDDAADILALKDAYEQLQSWTPIVEFGPLRAYHPSHHAEAQRLWREVIDPAVRQTDDTQTLDAHGTYRARAASPWHAYFYLRAQQQHVFRAGRPLRAPPAPDAGVVGEHLFFRGQRCASWPFHSSLRRRDAVTAAAERRAAFALSEYFRYTFIADADVASGTGRCFAQHYGIATDLVDVSCDPGIAIWFATHPYPSSCPDGEPDAVVRAVSWAGQRDDAPVKCLLAPPFVRNVYTQRGLFLDTSSTNGELTAGLRLEVTFPRETVGGEFRVRRSGVDIDVWPEPDAAEQALIAWARGIAAEADDDAGVGDRVAQAREGDAWPRFWLDRELYEHDRQVEEWLTILDWVLPSTCVTALPVASAQGPMQYEVLEPKVRALVRANPTFFTALVSATEGADFSRHEVLRQVIVVARGILDQP